MCRVKLGYTAEVLFLDSKCKLFASSVACSQMAYRRFSFWGISTGLRGCFVTEGVRVTSLFSTPLILFKTQHSFVRHGRYSS